MKTKLSSHSILVCLYSSWIGNELPLRHLFSHFDGRSSGPRLSPGPIGKLLQNCESQFIVEFDPILAHARQLLVVETMQDGLYTLLRVYVSSEDHSNIV